MTDDKPFIEVKNLLNKFQNSNLSQTGVLQPIQIKNLLFLSQKSANISP